MISPKAKGEGNAEVRVARSMRAARSIIQILLLCGVCSFGVADVMLLVPYKQELLENGSLEGYLVSEKLDGVRAVWNGKQLQTRQANPIFAPQCFTQDFPDFALDGELFIDRGKFEEVLAIVSKKQSQCEEWRDVVYYVFDVPTCGENNTSTNSTDSAQDKAQIPQNQILDSHIQSSVANAESNLESKNTQPKKKSHKSNQQPKSAESNQESNKTNESKTNPESNSNFCTLTKRLNVLEHYLDSASKTLPIKIIPQCRLTSQTSQKDLQKMLQELIKQGGEGLVVRKDNAPYEPFRTTNALKLKSYDDAECKAVGYTKGRGRLSGKMGSILCEQETPDGRILRFKIGSGFSDKIRENPPAIGSFITYKYFGYTKNNIPRFASFLRIYHQE